jgi:hypothetical protein
MKGAEQYKGYAEDCLRMAAKASGPDKEVLLKMAEAWKLRASAAEKKQKVTIS